MFFAMLSNAIFVLINCPHMFFKKLEAFISPDLFIIEAYNL
jgi:hypothetical protein